MPTSAATGTMHLHTTGGPSAQEAEGPPTQEAEVLMAAADKWDRVIASGVGNVSRAVRAKQIAEAEARRHPQPEAETPAEKPKPARKRATRSRAASDKDLKED